MARALIVGGGLIGPVLAVYLAKRGLEVDVFERNGDPRAVQETKRAALNITLCERGLSALARIGVRERILELCAPAYGRRLHAPDGTVTYQPYTNHGDALYSISRLTLADALISFAESHSGVRFHFNQKCVHVDLRQPSAQFEDQRTGAISQARADRVFGADGAYSTVRLQMQKTEHFNYSQQYWNQGYTSLRIPPMDTGEPALGNGALHIWPRHTRMLIAFPNRDASVSCSLLLSYRGEDSYESLSTSAEFVRFFRTLFPDVVGLIPNLAEQFFSSPPNSLLTVRCDPWAYGDKVLLIGDAAHAFLPSYGQGANAGFEDCMILDEYMAHHGSDWSRVFGEFERSRKPNVDAMADLCVQHFVELCELVADPGFLKRLEVERRLHELYGKLFTPLYPMITFTRMPYLEALNIARRQQILMDKILDMEGVDVHAEDSKVRRLLQGAVENVR